MATRIITTTANDLAIGDMVRREHGHETCWRRVEVKAFGRDVTGRQFVLLSLSGKPEWLVSDGTLHFQLQFQLQFPARAEVASDAG